MDHSQTCQNNIFFHFYFVLSENITSEFILCATKESMKTERQHTISFEPLSASTSVQVNMDDGLLLTTSCMLNTFSSLVYAYKSPHCHWSVESAEFRLNPYRSLHGLDYSYMIGYFVIKFFTSFFWYKSISSDERFVTTLWRTDKSKKSFALISWTWNC